MNRPSLPILFASLLALGMVPNLAHAQSRSDQGEARKEMKAGNVLSLREIERRVLPTMKGAEYLGPAYDSTAMAYRLKFIRDGRVMYVDVDARTGRIIRRSK
ncbi:MAG: PepSY domain-containing protein [Pontixanthobacter sp.]